MKRSCAAVLLLAAVAAGPACYEDERLGPFSGDGLTRVFLTDAPFPYDFVDRVEVYVVAIAASTEPDTLPGSLAWVSIAAPRKRFDLLALQQGTTALLGAGNLPAGQYRAVRMIIDTDSSSITLANGSVAKVRWPVAGELRLFALVEEPLAIADSGAQIVIDFDVGRSFAYGLFSPLYDFAFLPVIRAVNSATTGSLSGRVFGDADGDGVPEPLENAAVTVLRGDPNEPAYTWWVAATGHTGPDGRYTVGFLLAGAYVVQVDAPLSAVLGSVTTSGIAVVSGQETTHSVTLPVFDGSSIVIEGVRTIGVGDTTVLYVVVRDQNGVAVTNPTVRWQSLNAAVAAVSDLGEYATVFGLAQGVAPIIATSLGLSDSIDVVVGPATPTARQWTPRR